MFCVKITHLFNLLIVKRLAIRVYKQYWNVHLKG